MTAADAPAPVAQPPVPPVLVRDYRRLLRLFPYTYRRAHEAEMLGHLLDGAQPGQSRPTRAERWDLLRAAAREWLLAPLGSTPRQRRASTAVLVAVLPVLLALPTGRSLGSLATTLTSPATQQYALEWAPAAPAWALWAVGLALALAGRARAAARVGTAATGLLVVSLLTLGLAGDWHDVSRELGWLAPMLALLVVLRERETADPVVPRRALVASVTGALVLLRALAGVAETVPALVLPVVSVSMWALAMAGPLALMGVLIGGGILARPFARQSLPVVLGVLAGLWVGRFGLLDGSPLNGPGPDVLVPQGLVVVGVLASARWIVNRADELTEARARAGAEEARSGAPHPGEPTAV
ncbi:hypothetical protein ACWFQT_17410 [Cellulosimicrobium cellulans]